MKNFIFVLGGSGSRKLQYIFIDDVVNYVTKHFSIKPGVYNLGGEKQTSIKEVSKIIANFYNGNIIFKGKKERETLPFMSIKKIINHTKNYPSDFLNSLRQYLNSFANIA